LGRQPLQEFELLVKTLKTELENWTDWDIASFALARCLGLMSSEIRFALEAKHVFWTDHKVGRILLELLDKLVDIGVLLVRDEPDKQYKWNEHFVGSWEG
jgi:hypothetical protein